MNWDNELNRDYFEKPNKIWEKKGKVKDNHSKSHLKVEENNIRDSEKSELNKNKKITDYF